VTVTSQQPFIQSNYQRLFIFKLIYVIIVINLFFSDHRCPQGFESDYDQHESDRGQQEYNQNLNAEVQVNEDDDPMKKEMPDDNIFQDKQGIILVLVLEVLIYYFFYYCFSIIIILAILKYIVSYTLYMYIVFRGAFVTNLS
jgi:hypothetical protein